MFSFEFNGRHLMMDVVVRDGQVLANPEKGIKFLEDIVHAIDMTMILPPVTVKFPHAISELNRIVQRLEAEGLGDCQTIKDIKHDLSEREKESYGYSTFVMIAESHLSIHTFPELGYFSFDCYSCKYFDSNEVIAVLHRHFDVEKITTQTAERVIPE
jgi:S-adenosylmethionine decarboxylase